MSSFTGMEVVEVERLGQTLQQEGERVGALAAEVERLVASVLWQGPDARRFVHEWWPAHKARLLAVAEHLTGLGQSALSNASEQRTASGGWGGGAAPSGPRPASGSAGSGVQEGGGGGTRYFAPGEGWTADWRRGTDGMDQWNFAYDGDGDGTLGNCTSFVAWRLNQLGLAAGHEDFSFTNNHLRVDGRTVSYGRLGNAYEWYANAPTELRATEPQVGSVVVWEQGEGRGSYGHVAVVREVRPDGSIVIEESGWDSYSYRQRVLAPGQYPERFLNFLP